MGKTKASQDETVAYSTRHMPLRLLTRMREIAVRERLSLEAVVADVIAWGLDAYECRGYGEEDGADRA